MHRQLKLCRLPDSLKTPSNIWRGSIFWYTPTDRPKSVRNRCVIEVFGGVCVLSFGFRIFCWYRGFCHRTGSDLLLFLSMYNFLNDTVSSKKLLLLEILNFENISDQIFLSFFYVSFIVIFV